MAFKITLEERQKSILQAKADFYILLNGKFFGTLSYNMTGYIGYLPLPPNGKLHFGERSLTAYRREIAALNRETRFMERRT